MYNIEVCNILAFDFLLGVGRYTPSAGVAVEMGWIPPLIMQWRLFLHCNFWSRYSVLPDLHVNKVYLCMRTDVEVV